MDNVQFLELCKNENATLTEIVAFGTKEEPTDELAFKSLIIINDMLVDGVGDAMLYASALNVLNTYVKLSKENKKTVGYSFKRMVNVLFKYIIRNPSEYLDAEIQEDNGMSFGLVSIYGIQFSFHNITVTEDIQCLKAKDPDHPRIVWDEVKKQNCSVTLFDFAYSNSYGRTNKMLDGSDFLSYMDSLLSQFHSGQKAITDVLHSSTKKAKDTSHTEHRSVDESAAEYPDSNKYHVSLECYDLKTLVEKIKDRSLVPELNRIYERRTGQCLPYTSMLSGKYAFNTLAGVINKSDFSPSVGVYVSYDKVPYHESFIVTFTSNTQEDKYNVVNIELLSWTEMKMSDDGYVLVRDDYTGVFHSTCNPCNNILSKKIEAKCHNLCSSSASYKHYIFLYDAEKTEENSIASQNIKNNLDINIYYAADVDEMIESIGDDLKDGNGFSTAISLASAVSSLSSDANPSLNLEHELSVQSCLDSIKSGAHSLSIFNYRKLKNNTEFFDYFCKQLNSSGIDFVSVSTESDDINSVQTRTVLFNDVIPDEGVLEKFENVIVLCDLYAPIKASEYSLSDLSERAYTKHHIYNCYNIISALGFVDGGDGNNFLLRCFNLADISRRTYHSEDYTISLYKDSIGPIIKDGVKKITVPSSVGINSDKTYLIASEYEKEKLYQEFLDAPAGVVLDIEDSELLDYVEYALIQHGEYEENLLDTKKSFEEKNADIIKLVKNCADNTSDYNKYYSMVVQHIHKDAWAKLFKDSQDWVVTAVSDYFHTKDTDTSMDFSGVALLISKTFEVELCKRISEDYFLYIKEKYGDDYLYHLPDYLVKETPDGLKPGKPEQTTLGSMPYIMGLDSKGKLKNEDYYREFLAYCNDVLLLHPENSENDLKELCDIIYYVRVKFRNTSAHKEPISFEAATDCITYCITEKRNLGVIMDMFRK